MNSSREVKEVGVVQKIAVGGKDRVVGAAVGCLVSKKERNRDTAVSLGEARTEVSFVRHMYSKITPTVVSKRWKYGCYDA